MTEGLVSKDSLDHILHDYPVTNEDNVSKRYNFFYDLGSGAYATVKYATCSKTNKAYAVKIISKTKTPREYLRKFVPREVDALKRLSVYEHPHISQMREFFETSRRVYLVTKLAMGGDLLTYINSRKCLNEDTSRKMIAELLCALDHIHDLGIVHRDLKCENLLIGQNDSLVVSDFGFATQQPRNRLLTTFCGSYAYAAPEILSGSSYNGKCTDVWSVGVILYAMLNGKLPFNDTKPKNILVKIRTTPLTMIRRVSVACENFVRIILTISSMERPNVGELLLKAWVEPPLKKILKTLPDKLHPSCFKLSLPHKNSFRMSDSSDECMKVFSPRQVQDTTSPMLPVSLKIANEFIAENTSHKTTSTISERVKQKCRQVKTDLKTWASRKRKSVVSPRFANIEGGGRIVKPTTGKLMRISQPKSDTAEPESLLNRQKYAVPESNQSLPNSKTIGSQLQKQETQLTRLKYTVVDSKQFPAGTVDFKKMRGSKDDRSVSAVPPSTVTVFEKRRSAENRAKSCNPETKLVTTAGSKPSTGQSSGSSLTKNNNRDTRKETKRYAGTDSASINKQILNYLSQQRENGSYKRQFVKPTNLGLPPLQQVQVQAQGTDQKIKGRRRSSTNSTRTRTSTTSANKDSRVKEKTTTYDKAKLYQNIQSTINNKYDGTSSNRGKSVVTPTTVVAVHPKTGQPIYSHGFRRNSNPSQQRRSLGGPNDLSTVYH
ncbi:uncharacterized protein LOC134811206 [Bolinopsis microptera]|uniref:uncharacterized protein LOC134811206 n=1 Tax=Bolinopsis microptera TaxID=2820187 RepID=UPI003079A43E